MLVLKRLLECLFLPPLGPLLLIALGLLLLGRRPRLGRGLAWSGVLLSFVLMLPVAVDGLLAPLESGVAPLDAQQSKAVLNVLVEEQQRQMQEYANTIGARSEIRYTANSVVASPPDWNVTDWTQNRERAHERMLSSLQSSLTQEQLEHIEGILKREREAQRASMELMQAQGINDGGRNAIIATGSFAPIGGVSLQQVETREVEAPGED